MLCELSAFLFMPQLTEVLKDVKYIQSQLQMEIPAAAAAVFEKRFMFTEVRRRNVSHSDPQQCQASDVKLC